MAVFFQKISDNLFNSETGFEVKESRGMNLMIGGFSFFLMLVTSSSSLLISALCAIPATVFITKAFRTATIMIINKQGFYYYGRLVTDWSNFVSARFLDEVTVPDENSDGLSDKFSLVLTYYVDNKAGCYRSKIALTNTQNKSEEEIMAAINFYYRIHQQQRQ